MRMINTETKYIAALIKQHLGHRIRELLYFLRYGHLIRKKKIRQYLRNTSHAKLHFGGGPRELEGFPNTDVYGKVPINIAKKLPFEDNQFDLIYSSHVIEHIHKNEFKLFLRGSYRILKEDGMNIIAALSLESISKFWYCNDNKDAIMIKIMKERYSKHMTENCFTSSQHINLMMRGFGHKYLYDWCLIEELGINAGYRNVENIPNFEVPDEILKEYLISKKPPRWNLITETFLLIK